MYSVDWFAKTIVIPVSDLTLVSGTRYRLDMAAFLAECRRLEWAFADGLWAESILNHVDAQLDFAGSDYAAFDKVVNGYSVQFSAPATRVDLVGSNNNIIDVFIVNGISVVPSNSAGLQKVTSGSGLSVEQAKQLEEVHGQVRRTLWINPDLPDDSGNGYQQSPYKLVNSLIDDAEANGITTAFTLGDITLLKAMRNMVLQGIGLPTFNAAGFSLKGMELRLLKLDGECDGLDDYIIRDCQLNEGAGVFGYVDNCTLNGNIKLNGPSHIIGGKSNIEGSGYYSIDTNGFGIQVTDWTRSLGIKNMTSGIHTIHMNGGQLHCDVGCSGGTIHLRGNYSKKPENLGTTLIIDETEKADLLGTESFP